MSNVEQEYEHEMEEDMFSDYHYEPDYIAEVMGDIVSSTPEEVSIKTAYHLFAKAGLAMPDVVTKTIEQIHRMDTLPPGHAITQLGTFQALGSSLSGILKIISSAVRKANYSAFPTHIQRGQTEVEKAKAEAKVSDLKELRDYLKDLRFVTIKCGNACQTIIRSEMEEV